MWDAKNLYEKAIEMFDKFEFELCCKFCAKILLEGNKQEQEIILDALFLLSSSQIELGLFEDAKKNLLKATELDHKHSRPEKYMELAQLSFGEEALNYYLKGIEILKQKYSISCTYSAALISAYCAIAELFMSDLCDNIDSEKRCQEFIDAALELNPNHYEPLQCLCNLRLAQDNQTEAKEIILKSLQDLPKEGISIDYRLSTVKLLMELQLNEEALEILDVLALENDSVSDVWYLAGYIRYLQGEKDESVRLLSTAKEMMLKVNDNDPELQQHIMELLQDMQQ